MANSTSNTDRSIKLEDLMALNDEIIALVEADVPLELGLGRLGKDQSGAVAKLSGTLARRMGNGSSLIESLDAEQKRIPPIYRAVVEAGCRTGKLTSALEAVSKYAVTLIEMRQQITAALCYPLIVVVLAYGLFMLFLTNILDKFLVIENSFAFSSDAIQILVDLRDSILVWSWIPPLVLILGLIWWAWLSNSQMLEFRGLARPLGWFPTIRNLRFKLRCACFSDLLAMLVDHSVPLDKGIVLAANASGDRQLQNSAKRFSDALRNGEKNFESDKLLRRIPPYLRWSLSQQADGDLLNRNLRLTADRYRRDAIYLTEWLRLAFPILACITIGGGATLLYCLAVFVPFTDMMLNLAESPLH